MNYAKCDLCDGKGRINGSKCSICDGFGIWEFVAEDNEAALRFLNDPNATDVSDHAKTICGDRIHSLPPDYCETMLTILDRHGPESSFDALHEVGAGAWGWAWVHANRFAIALCRLNGSDPGDHMYGLTKLVWYWLDREQQQKVEVPWLEEPTQKISEKSQYNY